MSKLMIVEVPSYSSEFKGIREVAELVRCKECKHRGICFGKLVQGIEVVQLNFCSYGERESE